MAQFNIPSLGWCHARSLSRLIGNARSHAYTFSSRAASSALPDPEADYLEHPGGKVPYTPQLQLIGGPEQVGPKLASYRTIDSRGRDVEGATIPHPLSKEFAVKIYENMARLQTMDTLCYEAQRQVRSN